MEKKKTTPKITTAKQKTALKTKSATTKTASSKAKVATPKAATLTAEASSTQKVKNTTSKVSTTKTAANPKTADKSKTKKESRVVAWFKQPFSQKQLLSFSIGIALIIALIVILPTALTTWVGGNFVQAYSTTARHGYIVEDLGVVERKLPSVTTDGGLETGYPVYGRTMSLTDQQKNAIIAESISLCTRYTTNTGGSFDKMDENGYLYLSDNTKVLDSKGNHRQLYKHTAADSMYYGGLSDDEPAVCKRFTFAKRDSGGGYNVTGLYAPAGEIIKVQIKKDILLNAYTYQHGRRYNGVMIHIGQALYNGQANNIWSQRNINRMPLILSTFLLDPQNSAAYNEETETYTFYIGSYVGGPVYVRDTNMQISLTISGAVNYRHFVLGKTTPEEFNQLCNSTAPYFDLEVWDRGVLHSGPLARVKSFSYQQLYDAAILWDKITGVSTSVGLNGNNQCIVNIYDPFVAAGAAVAFPGRSSTNCPDSWMAGALNVQSFITGGMWGVMHEHNHNFQGWGLPGGGEVTNNALNLVSYSQFTKISASRTLTSSGMGGLSGWNAYTNAAWALNQVLHRNYNSTSQLCIYSTLLHNIGAENFMNSANPGNVDTYFKYVCNASGYDMSYFFNELIAQPVSETAAQAVKDLPKFVPVSCVYQTGRSTAPSDGNKKYFQTMQPFVFNYGEELTVDLSPYATQVVDENTVYKSGSVVLPNGFTYTIKNISNPQYGRLVKQSDYVYTYIPDRKHLESGKIYVTLSITKDDGAFAVDDVHLVLEFAQTHERNKTMLERTVYTYDNLPYTSAKEAYEAGYNGYASKTEENNINPTQNSNTDVWVPNPSSNAVMEIKGKLYVPTAGNYRLALRGRHSCALYTSKDGNTYTLAAELNHSSQRNTFWEEDDTTYIDFENLAVGQWIYFKEVLLVDYNGAFIGLGWGKFEVPSGVMDDDGIFRDENGNEITDFTPKVKLAYPSAYRSSYEFPSNDFTTQYLFTKNYKGTYNGTVNHTNKGSFVSVSGYTPWSGYSATLDELFDDNDGNWIHSAKSDTGEIGRYDITPQNPFDITVDLETEISANCMTIYGISGKDYQPKDFVLYGGTSLDNMKQIVNLQDAPKVGNNIVVNFAATTLRYYRLVCTSTYASSNPSGTKYIGFKCIKFDYTLKLENATIIAPDDKSISYRGKWSVENQVSNFGRLYFGKKNATATFTFTGSQFAIYSNATFSSKIKVFVDGKDCSNIVVKQDKSTLDAIFCSPQLSEGTHTVKIVCIKNSNISAILYK